jgi:hypothetical protein
MLKKEKRRNRNKFTIFVLFTCLVLTFECFLQFNLLQVSSISVIVLSFPCAYFTFCEYPAAVLLYFWIKPIDILLSLEYNQ